MPVSFHGTGDVFASALVGALTRERSLDDAVGVAVDDTVECLRETMRDPNHVSYGVNFETAIPYLLTRLGLAAGNKGFTRPTFRDQTLQIRLLYCKSCRTF